MCLALCMVLGSCRQARRRTNGTCGRTVMHTKCACTCAHDVYVHQQPWDKEDAPLRSSDWERRISEKARGYKERERERGWLRELRTSYEKQRKITITQVCACMHAYKGLLDQNTPSSSWVVSGLWRQACIKDTLGYRIIMLANLRQINLKWHVLPL